MGLDGPERLFTLPHSRPVERLQYTHQLQYPPTRGPRVDSRMFVET
jgi:hypothetical protein